MGRGKAKAPILRLQASEEQAALQLLKRFLDERFELQLGSFEVQEVLDLFSREIAPHYYNKAVADVQALLSERFASLESDVWSLEKS
jgi:uncharacterized protein (DUF2164 family)